MDYTNDGKKERERAERADIAGAAALRIGASTLPQWQCDILIKHFQRGGTIVSRTAAEYMRQVRKAGK
jgi:hypothetical protein